MQISSASVLAAQQARAQAAPPRAAAKSSADELFEPLFGKAEDKASAPQPSQEQKSSPAAVFARPGSQIDIRV